MAVKLHLHMLQMSKSLLILQNTHITTFFWFSHKTKRLEYFLYLLNSISYDNHNSPTLLLRAYWAIFLSHKFHLKTFSNYSKNLSLFLSKKENEGNKLGIHRWCWCCLFEFSPWLAGSQAIMLIILIYSLFFLKKKYLRWKGKEGKRLTLNEFSLQ